MRISLTRQINTCVVVKVSCWSFRSLIRARKCLSYSRLSCLSVIAAWFTYNVFVDVVIEWLRSIVCIDKSCVSKTATSFP